MKVIRTTLREDFGLLDRPLIRRQLLSSAGVCGVADGPGEHCLSIEYDPTILDDIKLLDLMCRHGIYPAPAIPSRDAELRGDG
jgi:hypothetical protein